MAKGNSEATNPYDQLPYPSHPYPQAHPDRLAAIARLFAVSPVARETASVLEIGCASGGHLIPLAEQFPQANFLGVDLSRRQIQAARKTIKQLALKNIECREGDIAELHQQLDEFDYIICHGVFSWVNSDTQRAIMNVCRDHLTPNGVAFISYNTYPGWHFRGMIRDMMCYHDNESQEAMQRVGQARALLKFLSDSVSAESSAYGMMLKSELDVLSKHSDAYLFHEHLEPDNLPLYFHQFMEMAQDAELQYLGDASISSMWVGNFPESVAATLQKVAPHIVQREQYTDFVCNRLFRQTLLCHAAATVDRNLDAERIADAFIAGRFTLEESQQNVNLDPRTSCEFLVPGTSRKIATAEPLVKAALVHLTNAWPAAIPFDVLFEKSQASCGSSPVQEAEKIQQAKIGLSSQLLRLCVSGMIELKFDSDRFTTSVSQQPKVSKQARWQAMAGYPSLTNARHELVKVDDFVRRVVPAIDGIKSKAQIVDFVQQLVESGLLVVQGLQNEEQTPARSLLEQAVDQTLIKLSKQALLIA